MFEPEPEPPEFPNVGCILAVVVSLMFWVLIISAVTTWLIVR